MKSKKLLLGAVDIHIHAAPSIVKRSLDAIEAAKEAQDAGMRGIVLKDHQVPTAGEAFLVNKYHVNNSGFEVFSGVVLNNHVGGLNPKAAETAILMGAKMVWLPTVSCEHHYRFLADKENIIPTIEKVPERPIRLIDKQGKITAEVSSVLDVLKENDHVAVATGHASPEEIEAFMEKAIEIGLKKILINHPNFLVDASIEQMKRWAALGAYIEICAVSSDPISHMFYCPRERLIQIIKDVGPENIIISSDYGQPGNPKPVEGLLNFLDYLMDGGIEETAIEKMIKHNPCNLLGLEKQMTSKPVQQNIN